ncbi:MAG: putative manganese transporter [Alphaproteobacteria bacterium]
MTKYFNQYKLELIALFRVMLIFAFVGWLPLFAPELSKVVYGSISDAYVGVSTWVGITLGVFYLLEHILKVDLASLFKRYKKQQVLISALLGGVPGCGGAIVVTTQYIKGNISFGALVATLTATMGDAAFLLIATSPKTALMVIGGGIVIGTISGYIVDMFPTPKILAGDLKLKEKVKKNPNDIVNAWFWGGFDLVWLLLLIPGFALTLANAMNIDINNVFDFIYPTFSHDLSVFIGTLTFSIFFARPSENNPMDITMHTVRILRRVVAETSFISAWVMAGFLLYDVTMYAFNLNLQSLFVDIAVFVPLIAIVIGWLPGCGPQIVVTTLYLNGIIPFSALMGNAISNDGDALFPVLSLAPRAGILATLYSTVPAIIVAYLIYFLSEV